MFPANPFDLRVARLDEVRKAMEAQDALLVDARPKVQFDGAEGMQMRLGHIPGALSHPWANDLVQTEFGKVFKTPALLLSSYEHEKIHRDMQIIAYCNTGTEASHVYFALHKLLSYPHVKVYVPSYTEWAEKESLPVEAGIRE